MEKERRKEKNRENIPRVLKDLPIWVGFKFTPQKGKKDKKIPVNVATGKNARCNDSKTWHAFNDVVKGADYFDAIGFAITTPYIGIDIDGCVADGIISSFAQKIISDLIVTLNTHIAEQAFILSVKACFLKTASLVRLMWRCIRVTDSLL